MSRRPLMGLTRRPVLCTLQALILVIVQLGAQAHAYSHLTASRDANGEPQRIHALACSECVAFAPLLATAGGSSVPLLHLPARTSTLMAIDAQPQPLPATHTAYRSRAPPARP
ncbi:MAG TPA: hypothetical protein VKC11_00940 [Steroidobacteraceae bacterium]|nr:hypothetical protein [Steroidobacteraceae bacterium]